MTLTLYRTPDQPLFYYFDKNPMKNYAWQYGIPNTTTFNDIDAAVAPRYVKYREKKEENTVYFQMTLSDRHPFNLARVHGFMKATHVKLAYFVYIVPQDMLSSFKYQTPKITPEKPATGDTARSRA